MAQTLEKGIKGPVDGMKTDKTHSTETGSEEYNARNVYMQCLNNLHTINMAMEYQQAIKEEMKKFSKLERAVSQKKSYQAERLASLVESKSGRSHAGVSWFEESVQSLIKQLVTQAHSHNARTDVLAKQGSHIQAFLDSHLEVMSILHDGDNECIITNVVNGPQSSSTSIPRPRSPRKSITASERRQETCHSNDGTKWYISPPPLTPPRLRNHDGPMADFRKAYVKYESIRKARIMLDNRLGYLQMQHKSIVNQLDEATNSMADFPEVPTGKMLPWSTQSKLEDLRSRQEFLKNQKEQTETEMKDVRKEVKIFETTHSIDMDQILSIFESTKNRYDSFLKQSLAVLKAAIVAESPTGDPERHGLKNNFDKCFNKANSWETFEDQTGKSSTVSASPDNSSNTIKENKQTHQQKQQQHHQQHPQHQQREQMSSTASGKLCRSSPVDPRPRDDGTAVYEKQHRYTIDVNPITGYWDETTNDTLQCGEDSSMSDLEGNFDGVTTNASTCVDASKWLFGSASAGLGAFSGFGKHNIMKDDGVSRRFSLPLANSPDEKHQVSMSATNNKTNNRKTDQSNSDLRANEQLDEKKEGAANCHEMIVQSTSKGTEDDEDCQGDMSMNKKGESITKNGKEEDRKIKNYINKYMRSLCDADGNLVGIGDGNVLQQSIWNGPEGLMTENNSPIKITVSKESRKKLRVCTVHPISPSSENLCREGLSNSATHLHEACKVSCRQEFRTTGAGDMEERESVSCRNSGDKVEYYELDSQSSEGTDKKCWDEVKASSGTSSSKQQLKDGDEGVKYLKMELVDEEEDDSKVLGVSTSSCEDDGVLLKKVEECSGDCGAKRSDDQTTVSRNEDDIEVEGIMSSQTSTERVASSSGYGTNRSLERNFRDPVLDCVKNSEKVCERNSTHASDLSNPTTVQTVEHGAGKETHRNERTSSPKVVQSSNGSPKTKTTGAIITLRTRKTKTMLLNPFMDSECTISNSDSDSDSISVTTSLTCSSSNNENVAGRTIPILSRPSGLSRGVRKWKKKDKNVRFSERVQYTTFETLGELDESEDRRNHYDVIDNTGNDNNDGNDSDDDDTFPLGE